MKGTTGKLLALLLLVPWLDVMTCLHFPNVLTVTTL
jgi:hypothetical protein